MEYHIIQSYVRVILVILSLMVDVSVCQAKSGVSPSPSNSDPAGPTAVTSQLRNLDYDYQDPPNVPGVLTDHSGRQATTNKTAVQESTNTGDMSSGSPSKPREDGLFYPLYGEAMAGYEEGMSTGGDGAVPQTEGMNGEWMERHEWLLERVKKLQRFGLVDELETLQKQYPEVNLTLLYNMQNSGYGEEGYEMEEGGYFHNGTYYRQSEGEMEDGYWYNGTFYPGEMEGPEMEDGYYYNGTFYPGEREAPDMEDGYFYNGTYYPGYEQEGPEQEGEEYEDLMWWQLHHPRWRDRHNKGKTAPAPHLQSVHDKADVYPAMMPSPPHISPQYQPMLNPQKPPHTSAQGLAIPAAQKLPMFQARPAVQVPQQASYGAPPQPNQRQLGSKMENLSQQAKMTGGVGQIGPASGGQGQTPRDHQPQGAPSSSDSVTQTDASVSDGHQSRTSFMTSADMLNAYQIPATVTVGIVLASIIGVFVIFAPLVCLLHKYRQEKRIRKRTFLKRSETGSVDDGIMDAMVMTELGESGDSRVQNVGRREESRRAEKHARPGRSRDWRAMSLSNARAELRSDIHPMQTRSIYHGIDDDPEIIIH